MAWYDKDWSNRKKITIDNTKVSGSGSHSNFPVLVLLASDTELANTAQDDGDDILFTSSDGETKLDHELVSFNGATGALIAWVRIPSLSTSADTDIYMYYGNAGASSQENAASVWTTGGKYVAVYHLENDANDSTGNHNGTNNGGDFVTGKVGTGIQFIKDNSDRISISSHADFDFGVDDPFAWVFWAKYPTGASSWERVFTRQSSGYTICSAWSGDGFKFMFNEEANSILTGDVCDDTWRYFAWVFNKTDDKMHLVINNSEYGSGVSISGKTQSGGDIGLGAAPSGGNPSNAYMDEVRIVQNIEDLNWFITEYNNQNSPSTFYTLGSEENKPVTGQFMSLNTKYW